MPAVGFRFRAYAGQQTLGALRAQLRLACEIYNSLRRADIDFHRRNGRGLTLTELRQLALDLRKRNEGYQQLHSQAARGIADRFHSARRRFLEGLARFPREKPHKYYSLTYLQKGWRILSVRDIRAGSRNRKKLITLRLSHLGAFRVIAHRDFPMYDVRRVAVKLAGSGRVYVSFFVEDYEFPRLPETGRAVAIDVGVEKLLVTSDGEYFPNLRPYRRALGRLRRLQRELSRKRFLSRNWFKVKIKLARAHEHLANLRRDMYMKLGRYFAERYDVVVMEDIDLKRLIGRSSRALRRGLQDAALGMMRSIIGYQVGKYGKAFILVDPRDSSRACARCGFVNRDLTLGDRVFECPACGWRVDRDYNASLNILRRAGWEPPAAPVELRPLPAALGYGQGGVVKQEAPPEGRGSSLCALAIAPRGYRRWTSWRSSGGRWALGAC
ncbi:MAG: transposase [Nitrososphaeria archaeon]